MSFDAFMYIPGEKKLAGETQDDDMSKENAFEIMSFDIGAENNINIGSVSAGGGAGNSVKSTLENSDSIIGDVGGNGSLLVGSSILSARLQMISEVAIVDIDRAMNLSASLNIPLPQVFVECFRVLWCSGKESDALDLLHHSTDVTKQAVAGPLVSLACEQVDIVLDAMRRDKRYRTLLSTVPSKVYTSVKSAARAARSARAASGRKDSTKLKKVSPSLSETHSLLSRLVPVLPNDSPDRSLAVEMAGVVLTLARRGEQLKKQRQNQRKK